jgi:hypothetical protein
MLASTGPGGGADLDATATAIELADTAGVHRRERDAREQRGCDWPCETGALVVAFPAKPVVSSWLLAS